MLQRDVHLCNLVGSLRLSFVLIPILDQIRELDPIRKASLVDMLRENLKECAALHGDAVFNAAISRIDPLVIAQLWQALEIE